MKSFINEELDYQLITYLNFSLFSLDMNECNKTGMCLNGRCINEMGRYRCECDDDFMPNPTKTACVGQCVTARD